MTQPNIMTDLGVLLKIPAKVTTELSDKACLCISSAIYNAKARGESQVSLNIGIGVLGVDLVEMQCKFIPSKSLKKAIKESLSSQKDPLELTLEQAFIEKLLSACEEVL